MRLQSKTMNVLYFLDPYTMKPGARWPTLKYHIEPMYHALGGSTNEVSMLILADEGTCALASKDASIHAPIRVIPNVESSRKLTGDERIEAAKKSVLHAARNFEPDLVISYEAHATWLKDIFPNARVINEVWGLLSRAPFPALMAYDPLGIYEHSVPARFKEVLLNCPIEKADKAALQAIRNRMVSDLAATDPIFPEADKALSRFRKLILLPLQLDDHDSFRGCARWASHLEMVEVVLSTMPHDIGVVVTQHPDHGRVIDEAQLAQLGEKYPHFIYSEMSEGWPMVSQYWLLHVDALATVSSGLAFQAALIGIPVLSLGDSHINVVASTDLAGAAEFIRAEHGTSKRIDNALWWMLTRYNVFYSEAMLGGPVSAKAHFQSMMDLPSAESLTADTLNEAWPVRYAADHVTALFELWSRRPEMIQLLKQCGIESRPNEILVKITEAEAVSYDLFDTLVQRPFMEPHDLFQMIEGRVRQATSNVTLHFARWRRKAEEEARKKRGGKEVTLDQIYHEFSVLTGYSPEMCEQIAAIELEAETHTLTRREPIYRTFRWGQRLGKVLSIITDIYLEQAHIERLLRRVGIVGQDHLFVSAELDLRKHDGTIYPLYLATIRREHGVIQSVDKKAVLHIGDNRHADIEKAREHDMRVHWIPRNAESLQRSMLAEPYAFNLKKRWLNDSVVMGLIANRFGQHLENAHKTSLFGGSLYAFGYMAGAPMLTAFVQWLNQRVRAEGYDKVAFVARDGYTLKVIYDRLRQTEAYADLPPSDYLYLSRRSTALAACTTTDDLIELLHISFGSRRLDELLHSRFGLEASDVDPIILRQHGFSLKDRVSHQNDLGRLAHLVVDLQDDILVRARRECEGLDQYLRYKSVLESPDRVCMVDIGYSGSIQRYVNKIYDSRIAGYYMLTHEAARPWFDGVTFEGWFADFDEQRSADYHKLNDHVFLFETMLSSHEDSVRCHLLDEHGKHYIEWVRENDASRKAFMREVHAGIRDFIEDFSAQLGRFASEIQIGQYFGSKVFLHLAERPLKDDARLFLGLGVENSFGGGDAHLLFNAYAFSSRNGPSKTQRQQAVAWSQWKAAALVLYGEPALSGGNGTAPVAQTPALTLSAYKPRNSDLPSAVRKYLKFHRDPHAFFRDMRNPLLRPLRFLYRSSNSH